MHTFKKLWPLWLVFVGIIASTIAIALFTQRYDADFLMRMFMASFFIVFGLFKVINLKGFVTAYRMYDILAQKIKPYAYAYPFLEIGLGVLFIWYMWPLAILGITILLSGMSAYGVWKKLQKKEEVPCACLGALFYVPMTYVTLVENLLMVIMALAMIIMIYV
ncbi:MAG: hypothetical protein LRY44_03535 [Candidatus Pacebacteria bacterium]|nr:hypothetical protein [Candidatus Paceibacterota bacterium]